MGGGPAHRATAAPPMGMAKGYRQQQKRPPPGHGESGVRAGREKLWLLPFKTLGNQHTG